MVNRDVGRNWFEHVLKMCKNLLHPNIFIAQYKKHTNDIFSSIFLIIKVNFFENHPHPHYSFLQLKITYVGGMSLLRCAIDGEVNEGSPFNAMKLVRA